MYQRSSKFDAAVRDSHRMALRVLITNASGDPIYDSAQSQAPEIGLIDGEITATTDAIRRTGEVTLVGDLPDSLTEAMINDNARWQFWRGITYPDGTSEMGSLGVFNPADFYVDDSGRSKRWRISLADTSLALSDHKPSKDFGFQGDVVSAVIALLDSASSTIAFTGLRSSPVSNARNIFINKTADPWAKALELLLDCGMTAYMDVQGLCHIDFIPDGISAPPVWDFIEGANSTFMNVQRTAQRRKYNHVVVTSEVPGLLTPIIAHAYDTDSSSPSYFFGPYGDVPYFVEGSTITSQAQADLVAANTLSALIGRKDSITISAVVNPFFEIGDTVYLERELTGALGYYIIDRISIPLTHTRPMYLTLRRRRNR